MTINPYNDPDIPNLPKRLFWEFDLKKTNWRRNYVCVIARVLDRGNKEDWKEIIRFYGYEFIVQALREEIPHIYSYAIDEVCMYFQLDRQELKCVRRRQERGMPPAWGE